MVLFKDSAAKQFLHSNMAFSEAEYLGSVVDQKADTHSDIRMLPCQNLDTSPPPPPPKKKIEKKG